MAIVASFVPILGTVAFVLGPLAIIFGIIGLVARKHAKKGTSITGIILGAVAVVIAVIVTALTAAFVSGVSESISSATARATEQVSVQYLATSDSGTATATFGTLNGTSNKKFTESWQSTGQVEGYNAATVTVSGDLTARDQQLTCEVKIDGKSVAKNSGTGLITCSGSTFGQ